MKIKILSSLFFLFIFFSHYSFSQCQRSDIEYYLDKGFSFDQVTQICSASSYKDSPDVKNSDKGYGVVGRVDDGYSFLKNSIDAGEVNFHKDKFTYVQRQCVGYESIPDGLLVSTREVCGKFKITVFNKDLVVNKEEWNLNFFGSPAVGVSGKFNKEIVNKDKLDVLTGHERKIFYKKLYDGKDLKIPIKKNIDLDRVREELSKVSV
ncbi:MAG: hypothetical protein ACRBBR_14535 [Cellvibrionaceae bacterium]